MLYGEPRLTHDVDIVAAPAMSDVNALVAAFPLEEFYCPPDDVLALEIRRGHRGHFNLIHHETGFKADVYIAYDELHHWALANAKTLDLDDFVVRVAPIEYVVVRKLEYYREGKSEKHLRDIRSILDVSGEVIDQAFLTGQVARRNLEAEWNLVTTPR